MARKLPYLIGLSLILLSGLAHGVWTGRWRSSHELAESAQRLAKVPTEIGDWQGTDVAMDAREVKQAGIVGLVSRRYVNSKTGGAVTLFLVSGPTGPIAVHSPEVCYPGVGFQQQGDRTETVLGEDKLWTIKLAKETALSRSNLVVYFGWNGKGTWEAPKGDPRFTFAGSPVIYKMYIIQDQRGNESDPSASAGIEFAKVLLPLLRATLFGNSQG